MPCRAIRSRGIDVLTALEAGMIERLDEHHLEYATVQGRVLYSFTVGDFYRLHTVFLAQGKAHVGIILAQQQRYTMSSCRCSMVALPEAAGTHLQPLKLKS